MDGTYNSNSFDFIDEPLVPSSAQRYAEYIENSGYKWTDGKGLQNNIS